MVSKHGRHHPVQQRSLIVEPKYIAADYGHCCVCTHVELAAVVPPPVEGTSSTVIDVSQFVRFEMHFKDIDYGVLDVTVTFHSEGQLVHLYLLHYFALTERHDKNSCLYEG